MVSWRRKVGAKKTRPRADITLKRSYLGSLPRELLVEVVAQLASTSESPICDLASVRATCKSLHEASRDKVVGQRAAVWNQRWMDWIPTDRYRAFLQACEDAGNLEASCILGVEEIYVLRETSSGLQHLEKARARGHAVATYAIGVFLFRHPATQHKAIEIFEEFAAKDVDGVRNAAPEPMVPGRTLMDRCRKTTQSMLRFTRINWEHILIRMQCTDETCGRTIWKRDEAEKCWVNGDEPPTNFCSSLCRWVSEYNAFIKNIPS